MTDRELLELAAKAVGLKKDSSEYTGGGRGNDGFSFGDLVLDWYSGKTWNPLTDDGDALRLAVKLGIDLLFYPHTSLEVSAVPNDELIVDLDSTEPYGTDPYAATRRAIVRAAAEIGKERKNDHQIRKTA